MKNSWCVTCKQRAIAHDADSGRCPQGAGYFCLAPGEERREGQVWSAVYGTWAPAAFQLRIPHLHRVYEVFHMPDGRAYLTLNVYDLAAPVGRHVDEAHRRMQQSRGSYPLRELPEYGELDDVGRVHGLTPQDAAGYCEACTESYLEGVAL